MPFTVVSMDLWVVRMPHSLHMSLETVVLIGCVLNHTLSAVSFMHSVTALDNITIADLPLALVISGMMIFDAVLVLVLGIGMVVLVILVVSTITPETLAASTATVPLSGDGHHQKHCNSCKLLGR